MPPARPGRIPAVVSGPMHPTEGGSAASVPGPVAADEAAPATSEIVVVGIVAVLAGGVLRFATRSGLWLDESLSVNIASLPVGDIASWLRHDGHPPLFYLLLHGWMELFGSGDVAVRALSGVFGLLTLPLAYLAGRRRGGVLLGWITLTVVALSPFAVRYSDEARMYSMVMFLVFAGYLLVDDVLRRGKDDWLRLAGIVVVAAALLYTHYWSLWLLAATGLVAIWRVWRPVGPDGRAAAWKLIGALALGGLLFVPWLPSMLYQSAHTGTPWAKPMRPSVAFGFTIQDFGAGLYDDAVFFALLTSILVVLGLFGRARDRRHIDVDLSTNPQLRGEAVVGASTFGIGIVIAFALRGAFATRYAAVIFPFLALLVAAGVTRFAARWVRFGVLLVLCSYLAIGALWNVADTRTQMTQIGRAIDAKAQPGDLVIYCPDQLGPAGSRATEADVREVAYPTFADPALVDWVDYSDRNASADPQAFAQRALAEAGPDHNVFLAWNTEYKTYEGQCEALLEALGAARPAQLLVDQDPEKFEHGYLTLFPAPS
jgi:mannosyltransferase